MPQALSVQLMRRGSGGVETLAAGERNETRNLASRKTTYEKPQARSSYRSARKLPRKTANQGVRQIAMGQSIAIEFSDSDTCFILTFSDLPECVVFLQSLEDVRGASANDRIQYQMGEERRGETSPGSPVLTFRERPRTSKRKAQRRLRSRRRLARSSLRPRTG